AREEILDLAPAMRGGPTIAVRAAHDRGAVDGEQDLLEGGPALRDAAPARKAGGGDDPVRHEEEAGEGRAPPRERADPRDATEREDRERDGEREDGRPARAS